jgi:ABC-2 type transport system ATP-binding protein
MSKTSQNAIHGWYKSVKKGLRKIIPKDIYLFYAKKRWALKRNMNAQSLRFEVHLTEHCNLNCSGCTHFSPIAEEAYLDAGNFERDCAQLAKLVNHTREVGLLGGEPLLHKSCVEFMRIARKYFPQAYIYIATNGILLDKQKEEFWDACVKYNIAIQISDYPIKINMDKIKEITGLGGIILKTSTELDGVNKENSMHALQLDMDGTQNGERQYELCMFTTGNCITLRDGKLYPCCVAAHICHFVKYFSDKAPGKIFQTALTDKNYIDIFSATNEKELLKFAHHQIPLCNYCRSLRFNLPYGHSKKDISEWT